MPIPTEAELASEVYDALQRLSSESERSEQSSNYRTGVSDLGYCKEKLRFLITQEPPSDPRDYLTAFIGTALGDHLERAVFRIWPDAVIQMEITVRLLGALDVTGHPDVVLKRGAVLDFKSVEGLSHVEKHGSSRQQRFQLHLNMAGLLQMGYFKDVPPEDLWVADVWIDRSGKDTRLVAKPERYDPEVVREAEEWLGDVIYAVRNLELAEREVHVETCQNYCEWFSKCRGSDVTVGGVITDPKVVSAAQMYDDARKLEKRAERMKEEAKSIILVDGPNGTPEIEGLVTLEDGSRMNLRAKYTNREPRGFYSISLTKAGLNVVRKKARPVAEPPPPEPDPWEGQLPPQEPPEWTL